MMPYRMIYLCFADYQELCDKGVAPHGILQRGDKDFFERVVNVHIGARGTRKIELDAGNVIYEFGIGRSHASFFLRFCQLLYAPVYLLRVIGRVYAIAKREKIDFIRGVDPYWCGFIAFIVSRLLKIPCCISLHADYDKRGEISKYGASTTVVGSPKLGNLLSRYVLRRAGMILPIRESLGAWAVKNGAKTAMIRVIPHGIDFNSFLTDPVTDIYDYFGIDRHLRIISFIGRISKENYVDDVLQLARKLAEQRTDFRFVIAGGGSEENRLRNIVNNDKVLRKVIHLTGFQKQEICFALRMASALSICLMGGFSLIEACAAGRPVVSYDVEWHSELVKDQETGFLVKEGDFNGLAKAVGYLLDHPEQADQMGRNAQKLAFERHDIQKSTMIKRDCYLELLRRQVK